MELYRAVGFAQVIPQIPAGSGRPRRVKVETLAGQWAEQESVWTPKIATGATGIPPENRIEFSMCTGAAIAQDRLEPIIRDKAIAMGADLRMSTTLVSFEQDLTGVTALLQESKGHEYSLRASYMVGADGHASSIRTALRIDGRGRGNLQTVRSVLFTAPLDEYLQSGISQFDIVQADFTAMLTTYRDGRWLLMFSDDEERNDATLKALISKAIGRSDLDVNIITTGRWELSATIADRFAAERVFLVGDAAHTLPPSRGGYGVNTGIEDAHNLAWKLAAVLNYRAAPKLLETYDAERRPIAWLRFGQIFARPDYASFARQSDKSVEIIDDDAMEFGQLYRSGAVYGKLECLPAALRPDRWRGQPGTRAPHIWVSIGGRRVSTLDLVQPNWVLLTQDAGWCELVRQLVTITGSTIVCKLLDTIPASHRERGNDSILDAPIERVASSKVGLDALTALLPYVMAHADYEKFKSMSLRQLKEVSAGRISEAELIQVELKLADVADADTLFDLSTL